MPIRQAARIATGNDGSEKPIQSPMIVTPYGRGRLVRNETPVPTSPRKVRYSRNVARCRHRLNTISASTSPPPRIVTDHAVPRVATARIGGVSQSVRSDANAPQDRGLGVHATCG